MTCTMRRVKLICFLLLTLALASCSEYNKILKSTDRDLKYSYAKKYFNEGKYSRSIALLEELVPFMKGTAYAEESLYLLAQSHYNSRDYFSATQSFTTYYTSYPKGEYAESALFYSAYGMYLDSPDSRLDQSKTYTAIIEFQKYIERYPQTERAEQAKDYLFELQEKLALKELQAAQLYLNLGNYMGNNYEAAVITAREAMKSYPYSKYMEDYQIIILRPVTSTRSVAPCKRSPSATGWWSTSTSTIPTRSQRGSTGVRQRGTTRRHKTRLMCCPPPDC